MPYGDFSIVSYTPHRHLFSRYLCGDGGAPRDRKERGQEAEVAGSYF